MSHRPTKQNACKHIHDDLLEKLSGMWPPLGKLNVQVVVANIELLIEMRRRAGPRECNEWFPGLKQFHKAHFQNSEPIELVFPGIPKSIDPLHGED